MKAYYGSRLSENQTLTPEGYLICLNVPIARTGTQRYHRYELGLEDDPNETVDVFRTEEEVFSPATIASFEGKPVTDEHPPDSVTRDNITAFDSGHAQNVRRETGDEADMLLADLFITSPRLIEAIRDGRREVSCGYDCRYEESGGRIFQRAIRGNHIAVVPAGRAGHRVAIKDSATEQTERDDKTMANKLSKQKSLLARLFSHAVKDMEPDEVADAIEELNQSADEEIPAPAPAPAPAVDEITLEGLMAAVKELAGKVEALCAAHDEEPAPAPADEEAPAPEAEKPADEDPLEKLAGELAAVAQAEKPVDEEAAVTVPTDELPETTDEDGPEAAPETLPENPIPGADRAIAALTAIRPVIAALPKEQRKAASDAAAAEIRKLMGRDAKPQRNGYADLSSVVRQAGKARAKDAKPADQGKIGMSIMQSRNPHYKK